MKALAIALIVTSVVSARAANWPQFRGPGGTGIGESAAPPAHFGPASNVLWKTSLPAGHSSPCIWENCIFLTAHDGAKLETICLNRDTGAVKWRVSAPAEKIEPAHKIATPASSTCVTDGARVVAYFGSFGLLAFDLDGREQWRVSLPAPVVEFGTGTSPILADELLILVCDQDQGSYLLALDKRTGKTAWRVERPEFRRGFSTPLLWSHNGTQELVVPGSIWLTSYDPASGRELWRYSGTSRVANSTPVSGDGLLFYASWNIGGDEGDRVVMAPFAEFAAEHDRNKDGNFSREEIPAGPVRDRFSQMDLNKDGKVTPAEWQNMREMFASAENAVIALRTGGKGDITRTHLAWKSLRSLPYVSSPLHYRGRLYTVKNGGLFSCYDAKSGRVFFQDERLDAPGDYYSSAVAADGKIFVASQKGVVTVITAGDTLDVLARNDLREQIFATPAILNGNLYLRTVGALYAFGPVRR